MDDTSFYATTQSEPLPVDHDLFMEQGALSAAGVRRVWAGAGLQRAAYRGGGILRGLDAQLVSLATLQGSCRTRYTPEMKQAFTTKATVKI